MRRDKAIKYFRIAKFIATELSKDPNTKVGCLLLSPDSLEILSCGFNGFPRGVDESNPGRWKTPTKYHFVMHAELNSLINAAKSGTNINDSIAVTTMYPCVTCCKALIQAGVREVVTMQPDLTHPKWGEEFLYSQMMLREVGIEPTFLTTAEVVG